MKRTGIYILALFCLLNLTGAFAQTPPLIDSFTIGEPAFSPDGDSTQDTTRVTFSLSASSPSVSVIVYQSDSVSVVDTLIAPGPFNAGATTVGWDGRAFDGGALPEGLYLVTLTARTLSATDTSATLPVAIDNTPPVITILGAEPGVFAPGLFGTPQIYTVSILISDSSPTYGLPHLTDELAYDVTTPIGGEFTPDNDWFEPVFTGSDGTYAYKWDGTLTDVIDGFYPFEFVISDKAGHAGRVNHYANVDADAPEIKSTNIFDGDKMSEVPDRFYGWARDRSGIDSLYARYSDSSQFHVLEFTQGLDDTVLFDFPLADSLPGDGDYKITIRAKDAVAADTGRVALRGISITVDTTAPDTPRLDPFDGTWRNSVFPLNVSWARSPAAVKIFRNDAQIDSVFVVSNTTLEKDVPLVDGQNVFYVIVRDLAGNNSDPSNTIRVIYDTESGMFIPAPFHPGDQFNVNLSSEATEVILRLYDMSGDMVVSKTLSNLGRNYAFIWDGLNGTGNLTKKGPLVAVAEIHYSEGRTDVLREIFLFDPDG